MPGTRRSSRSPMIPSRCPSSASLAASPSFTGAPRSIRSAGDSDNAIYLWNIGVGSLRLDVGSPDHLAPFVGLINNEFLKFGGRERQHGASQVGNSRLHLGISKSRVYLFVELVDNFSGRIHRCP